MSQYSQGVAPLALKAAADLSTKQYFFVKLTASRKVNIAAGATTPVFVLQNKPDAADDVAEVAQPGSTTKVKLGGTVTYGDHLTSDSAGKAIVTVTNTNFVGGIALESGVTDDLIEMLVAHLKVAA